MTPVPVRCAWQRRKRAYQVPGVGRHYDKLSTTSRTRSTQTTETAMSDKSQAQAVELLTLDKALLIQLYHGETLPLAAGPCHVLLVSLDEQAAEAYLLLTVSRQDEEKDGIEVVVGSNHVVVLEPGPQGNKYRLQSPEMEGAEVILTLPPEAMINGQEEAFADVVEQYCGLHRPGPDTPQGRIELIDDQGSCECRNQLRGRSRIRH